MHPQQEPTFLPLTVSVTGSPPPLLPPEQQPPEQQPPEQQPPEQQPVDESDLPEAGAAAPASAGLVRLRAEEADAAAAGCWAALLGDCGSPDLAALPSRLDELVAAASEHVGRRWWFGDGSAFRRKVTEAQSRITDAVREGDGAEFAEAFVGYDQAVATAVVSVRSRLESPTP